jgi:hypothetical protein
MVQMQVLFLQSHQTLRALVVYTACWLHTFLIHSLLVSLLSVSEFPGHRSQCHCPIDSHIVLSTDVHCQALEFILSIKTLLD